MAGWTAFTKHSDIFKGNIGTCLNKQVYNSSVLPVITYAVFTRAITCQAKNKLPAVSTEMERSMLNITYLNRKKVLVKENTMVTDVIE